MRRLTGELSGERQMNSLVLALYPDRRHIPVSSGAAVASPFQLELDSHYFRCAATAANQAGLCVGAFCKAAPKAKGKSIELSQVAAR